MSIILLEDEEPQEIWEAIHQDQIVFHPRYAPEGIFNFSEIFALKRTKNVMVFLDRNLLSGLLELCENGIIRNEIEMRRIALLMIWALMNQFPISAGLAIKENANKVDNSNFAKIELKRFNEIFDFYPSMMWLRLAQGAISRIPTCKFSDIPYETSICYHQEDDHLLMHFATMLHVAYLYRRSDMSVVEKVISFWNWNFKNLLISQYTNTYIILLFSNQEGIKPPKNVNSDNIDKIVCGCYNQAWDLSYLSNWSTLYWDGMENKDVFLFATADIMLKRIFINTHGDGDLFDLIESVFPRKQASKIIDCYVLETSKRVKPNFGEDPNQYFRNLIDLEKDRLLSVL